METAAKGNATEAAVLNALVVSGFEVLVPFGSGHTFDLVVHLGVGRFLRIQCKTGRPADGCVAFNCRTTDHGRGRLPYAGLVDVFGVYFPPCDSVYIVPVAEALGFSVRLRLRAARNNQKQGIRFAEDYLIDRWSLSSLRDVLDRLVQPSKERALQLA